MCLLLLFSQQLTCILYRKMSVSLIIVKDAGEDTPDHFPPPPFSPSPHGSLEEKKWQQHDTRQQSASTQLLILHRNGGRVFILVLLYMCSDDSLRPLNSRQPFLGSFHYAQRVTMRSENRRQSEGVRSP